MSKRRSPRLVAKFRSVTAERLARLESTMASLEEGAEEEELGRLVARELHTLKGEAKLMGFEAISQIAHAQEELLPVVTAAGFDARHPAVRAFHEGTTLVQRLAALEPDAPDAAVAAVAYEQHVAGLAEGRGAVDEARAAPGGSMAAPRSRPEGEVESVRVIAPVASLRVDTKRLEGMAQVTEEMRLAQSHLVQWLGVLDKVQLEAEEVLRDLRTMATTGVDEAAPHETIEALIDTAVSVRNRQELLSRRLAETRAGLEESIAEARSGYGSLESQLQALRLVPISSLFDAYRTAVREMSAERDKQVRLRASGADVEVDASVLERIEEPLLHIIRNAIDHGIETPIERRAVDKDETATLTLRATQRGSSVVIQVTDDGRGIDARQIRAEGLRRGLIDEGAPEDWATAERLLLSAGFSTRHEADEVSGRGLGLDIVRTRVEAMAGTLRIESRPRRGTRVEVAVPATVLRVPILLVEVAGGLYGLPSHDVRIVEAVPREEVDRRGARPAVRLDGELWPVETLGSIMRLPDPGLGGESVVLLEHRERPLAVFVDRFLREESLIVRELTPFTSSLRFVTGTSLSSEGRVVVLLNVNELCRAAMQPGTSLAEAAPAPRRAAATVLVVDDSELTRDMLVSLVEDGGYDVLEAVDGREALRRIEDRRPDVVLTDLEMPVMDGFELLRALRADEATRDLPVVVCSTRGADADKRRASELGADAYVVKAQFSGDVLLRTLGRYASRGKE